MLCHVLVYLSNRPKGKLDRNYWLLLHQDFIQYYQQKVSKVSLDWQGDHYKEIKLPIFCLFSNSIHSGK